MMVRAPSYISIHTPARGVTTAAAIMRDVLKDFDPHPREGGDARQETNISAGTYNFDPHPREGGDLWLDLIIPLTMGFRSTPPRGG